MKSTILRKAIVATAILFFISIVSSSFIIKQDDWEFLGERKVNFLRDKDVFVIHTNDVLSAIRMKVVGRDIGISEVKVYFANGDKLEPVVDDVVKAGESTRIVSLPPDGRRIEKIEFKYRTIGSVLKGRADIQLYGRKAL